MYFTVPPHEGKQGKLGQPIALKGFFVGYSYSRYLQPYYRVVARYANGTYGRVRITKDVIFHLAINFKSDLEKHLPSIGEFNNIPSLELVHGEDNVDALRRQLIMSSAIQEVTTDNPSDVPTHDVETSILHQETSSDPYLPSDATEFKDAEIGTKYDADGNIKYWYNMRYNIPTTIRTGDPSPAEFSRVIQLWKNTKLLCAVEVRDHRVPTSNDKAIVLPAITTELGKFRDHNCPIMTPYSGQHLCP